MSTPILHGSRILLVEDRPEAASGFRSALRQHGAEVIEASDVEAVLTLLDALRPDVVVTDLALRDDALVVREQARALAIPVITLGSRDVVLLAEESPRDRFAVELTKPVTAETLCAQIEALLRGAA